MTSMKHDFKTFALPGQPSMFARVILASRHAVTGRTVYTLHLRYPRIIHAELMTHRVFSRNARSSRAVPVKTMLREVRDEPFVPWHWTRNQRGMQGEGEWNAPVTMMGSAANFVDADIPVSREAAWLYARDLAVDSAESFAKAQYHKQVANRLIEPFSWIDVLVTSTHWANFMHLRNHPDAEPHIRDLAVLVGQALEYGSATAQFLEIGDWHTPYVSRAEIEGSIIDWINACQETSMTAMEMAKTISAARSARISYAPFDGDPSYERELGRYKSLVGNDAVHASPLEHQCMADNVQLFDDDQGRRFEYTQPELHGNLTGFIQFRKTVPNEAVHD